MKKFNYLLIACLVFASFVTVKSQSDTTKLNQKTKPNKTQSPLKSTTIGAFIALPMGEFGKTDIENGGFAKQGYGFAFDSKNLLGSGLSFVSHSSYAWVDIDVDAMTKAFDKEFETSLGAGYETSITGGQHQPFLSTLGLNYDYYFTKRISCGINAQAGIMYNSFRPMTIKVYNSNINQELYNDIVSYESGFAFAYGFGADLSFTLIPNLVAFQITADYSAGNLDTYLVSKVFSPIKSVENMQFLNLGVSLVFTTK